ncbi:MAG TPA: hypothetical protein VFI34_04600 [Candidatus Limnocylindrales bacterium]|nr:hypothetical protein [Candidatus Limnocylindrales bacterium]
MFSLILQYFSFALAPAALAVHDEGLFELDGNTVANDATAPIGPADDWDSHPGASGNRSLFISDPLDQQTDGIYTGGNTKDDLNTSGWKWTTGSVPDKDNIEHAFAVSYEQDGHTFVYFGLDRYANNGDAFTGFWFFKGGVGPVAGGTFSGPHQVGDLLVLANFTNGGSTSTIQLYEWVGAGNGSVNGTLDLLGTGQECTGSPVDDKACAMTNSEPIDPSWTFDDKGASGTNNDIPAESFFEGGIDLDQLFGGTAPCFGSFIAETRASQSVDAVLKDFAGGAFDTCVPPTIATDSSKSTVHFGETVTDTATLSGNDGKASGTVTFFVCGPSASAPDCSTGGTKVGSAVGVTTSANGGTATSAAFTPTQAGFYCWRAEYAPDANSQYLAGTHTNQTTECFEVVKNAPAISTSANQTVSVGQAIADSASLTGATSDAGGSITFKAYGPGDTDCSNAAAFTSSAFPVNGNGSYGPASFTPATAGTYRWIASYTGDAKNASATGQCNDTGETDTVNKVSPQIATQASASVVVGGKISDTATVSGGSSPSGSVTFVLYAPGDTTCQTPIFTSANRPLSSGAATSAEYTTTQAGTYRWIATYNGDANNNSVSGACNDANENVVVTKTTPGITTQLVGDGKTGASITVPLGTAVHDTSALSSVTATAGGTVHYQVFTDAQCDNLMSDAGTANVVNGVPGNSINITFNQAGTYYWQADYSGDANNNAASSACNLETVTVDKNIPTISTTASGSVLVGGKIHDTAHLTGGFSPTGTITFTLYGPNDATCATPISTSIVAVSGNGDYDSDDFTANQAGTYRWIAAYSGDLNNAPVAGGCNDDNESVIVSPNLPTVTTNASASVEVGGQIHDTAHLAGGFNPTGSITFNLYGPNDTSCANAAIFTDTVTVNGNGDYVSGSFTTSQTGTYRWIANYGGDANNGATANACNAANENVVVTPKNPTVTTNASASVVVGGTIHDTATLAGGFSPTGTLHFALYGPDDASCSNAAVFSADITVTGNGDYQSGDYTATQAGTYRWIANYGGDANNTATSNDCNEANENVVVTKASPAISTLATEGAQVGDKVHDVATVSGGFNPSGTVTFKLYGPSDPNCDSSAIFTDTVALGADGTATSGDYTVTEQGNFHWVASYSGDANNESASGKCGDAGETTVVSQFNPDITTELHSGDVSGAKITVLFGSTVSDQATLTGASATAGGTVTYTVYSDSSCTTVYADAGSKAVTNGVVPASDGITFPDAGTYYWQASYGGDAANAPATSVCTDEVLTVTTPDLHATKLVRTNDGSFGPTSTANPGDTLTFQITVVNNGDGDATNVPVSDDITDVLAHATLNSGSCNPSCDQNGNVLSWTIPTIAKNGGSATVSFSVTLDSTFPDGTTHLPNVVVVTGPGSNCEADSGDPDCDTDTTVQASPDLNAEKEVAVNDGAFGHGGAAQPGDTLQYRITVTNTGDAPAANVPVSDDISALVAHGAYNDDCNAGCTFSANTLHWTIASIAANGGSATLTFSVTLSATFPTGTTDLPNVVVVTGPGSNCAAASTDADCATDNQVTTSAIDIEKDVTAVNHQPPVDDPDLHVPGSEVGDTISYTLHYHGEGPIDDAVITDVIPAGLQYVAGTASSDAAFTFQSYNSATRTLTWTSAKLLDPKDGPTVDGELSYDVTATEAAAEGPQPLINTATIVGHTPDEQELTDSDTAAVTVLAPPLDLTPPPTSTITPETGTSNPGYALMLILLGIAGLSLGIGFITPVPAAARRRDQRRR